MLASLEICNPFCELRTIRIGYRPASMVQTNDPGSPADIARHLVRLTWWSTDLRYAGEILGRQKTDEFMKSVVAVATWAEGRM
jgi:hypothetical protein